MSTSKRPAADGLGAGQKPEREDEAERKTNDAGIKEEPARTVEQQEAEVTPAVAPGAQMRRAAAAVGRERGRNLGDAKIGERGFDDHLAGKLHAGGAQIEAEDGSRRKARRPQWKSPDGDAEKEAADGGEHGVAEVSMQRRHRAGLDIAAEAVAHDQVVAGSSLVRKRGVAEVVAGVGIGHEDVFAAGGFDAGHEGGAVARMGTATTRAPSSWRYLRAVGAAVVGDEDFAVDVVVAEGGDGLANAEGERLCLVEEGIRMVTSSLIN